MEISKLILAVFCIVGATEGNQFTDEWFSTTESQLVKELD